MHFTVIRASEAPDLARAMYEGQRAALRPYGIDHLAKPGTQPDAYLVAAELAPGKPIGGLRLQQRLSNRGLPLESSITASEAIARKLDRYEREGLVELGGMWVAEPEAETHLADRLVYLGLEVAAAAGMRHVVALGGQHSIPLALRTGFRLGGGEPVFAFPDTRYRSRLVWFRTPQRF
jgi:hypothetical protein